MVSQGTSHQRSTSMDKAPAWYICHQLHTLEDEPPRQYIRRQVTGAVDQRRKHQRGTSATSSIRQKTSQWHSKSVDGPLAQYREWATGNVCEVWAISWIGTRTSQKENYQRVQTSTFGPFIFFNLFIQFLNKQTNILPSLLTKYPSFPYFLVTVRNYNHSYSLF